MDFERTKKYEITLDNYKYIKNIGKGQFGIVNLYLDEVSKKKYAVKFLEAPDDTKPDEYERFVREVTIQAIIEHNAIIHLTGYNRKHRSRMGTEAFIMSPYMENGSLDMFVRKDSIELTPTQKMIILYGTAAGMDFLHNHGIIHRDMKPANILLDEFFRPYIADFGFSKYVPKGNQPNFSIRPGTPLYLAPELLDEESQPTNKVDVYAYGIIVFNVLTCLPFSEKTAMYAVMADISEGKRPTIPDTVPLNFKMLIESCWAQGHETRPSFRDIVLNLKNPEFFLEGTDIKEFEKYIAYVHDCVDDSRIETNEEDMEFSRICDPSDIYADALSRLSSSDIPERPYSNEFGFFTFVFDSKKFTLELNKKITARDALFVISSELMIPANHLELKLNGEVLDEAKTLSSYNLKMADKIDVNIIKALDSLPLDRDELQVEVDNIILSTIGPSLLSKIRTNWKNPDDSEMLKCFSVCGRSLDLFSTYGNE